MSLIKIIKESSSIHGTKMDLNLLESIIGKVKSSSNLRVTPYEVYQSFPLLGDLVPRNYEITSSQLSNQKSQYFSIQVLNPFKVDLMTYNIKVLGYYGAPVVVKITRERDEFLPTDSYEILCDANQWLRVLELFRTEVTATAIPKLLDSPTFSNEFIDMFIQK